MSVSHSAKETTKATDEGLFSVPLAESDPEIAGLFVYHCHVLDHEDGGMMAEILVNP